MVLAAEQTTVDKTEDKLIEEYKTSAYIVRILERNPVRNGPKYDHQAKIFQEGKHTCSLFFKENAMYHLDIWKKPPSYWELAKLICFSGYLLYKKPDLEIPVYMDTERNEPLKVAKLMQKSKKLSKKLWLKCHSNPTGGGTAYMWWRGKIKTISKPPKIKSFPIKGEIGDEKNGYHKYSIYRKKFAEGHKINIQFDKATIEAGVDHDRKLRYLSIEGKIPDHKFAAMLLSYSLPGKVKFPLVHVSIDENTEKRKFIKSFPRKLGEVKIQEYTTKGAYYEYAAGYIHSLPGLPKKGEASKKFLKRVNLSKIWI